MYFDHVTELPTIRGETNIEFRVRTNSCPNERSRMNILSRLPSLRNVVKDRRCVACKLRLHSSIDKPSKQSKEHILLWWTRWIPSSGSLLQRLLRHALEWLHHACLFYAARRSAVLCTCAFAVMYPIPWPKAITEGAVMSSTFSLNCALSAVQDVGTRNRTVVYMYDVHFAVRT